MNKYMLKQIRIVLGYTQKELAEKVGIEPTYICKLERGTAPFSAKVSRRIQEVYEAEGINVRKIALIETLFHNRI
ncbi:hypothetical protein BABA_02152 [Neobacillus bataviensis LMG 21833]|uniref:HTH cro/C1-type domain-containing protein n=1 Tax=Neobacillus bataviensis LMG 21833 TaxID=1117379 RepID=K6ECX2_9BACI|nr:helix-turn-helix transcriptional regulator [Neobacillus bataviensis]EKN71296.1 hypothetical protein BABA_02152 [Neobacillus bataviensis LMG 21833]